MEARRALSAGFFRQVAQGAAKQAKFMFYLAFGLLIS
jgi:hypothetical protein